MTPKMIFATLAILAAIGSFLFPAVAIHFVAGGLIAAAVPHYITP